MLYSIISIVSGTIFLPVAYFVTFVYPAAYAMLALTAAFGVVKDQSNGSNWNYRNRIHVYLAVAFADWAIHQFLYLLFPLTLIWGYLSLTMGIMYAIPVWGMVCIAAVGVLVGNRYMWYHNPDNLPEGAEQLG